MFCPNCGKEMADDAAFCSDCGTKIPTADEPAVSAEQSASPAEQTPAATPSEQTPAVWPAENLSPAQPHKRRFSKGKIAAIAVAAAVAVSGCGVFAYSQACPRDFQMMVRGSDQYTKAYSQIVNQKTGDQIVSAVNGLADATASKTSMSVHESATLHITPDSGLTDQLTQNGISSNDLNTVVSYINTLTTDFDCSQSDGQTEIKSKFSDADGSLISANCSFSKDGNLFAQIPQISNTYLCYSNTSKNSLAAVKQPTIDKAKFKTSMQKFTNVLNKQLENGKTAVTADAPFTIHGVKVQGEKLSITLNSAQASQAEQKLLEELDTDDNMYQLYKQYSDAATAASGKAAKTREDYHKMLSDAKESAKDKVNSMTFCYYVDRSNNMLARTCELQMKESSGGFKKLQLQYACQGAKKALDVLTDDKDRFYAVQSETNNNSGKFDLMFLNDDSKQVGCSLAYSGHQQDTFMGRPIHLGTYTLALNDPDHVVRDQLKTPENSSAASLLQNLTKSKLTVTMKLNGKQLNTRADLKLEGLADVQLNAATTEKANTKVTMPDVPADQRIDLNDASSNSTAQGEYAKSAIRYLANITKTHSHLTSILRMAGLDPSELEAYAKYLDTEKTA